MMMQSPEYSSASSRYAGMQRGNDGTFEHTRLVMAVDADGFYHNQQVISMLERIREEQEGRSATPAPHNAGIEYLADRLGGREEAAVVIQRAFRAYLQRRERQKLQKLLSRCTGCIMEHHMPERVYHRKASFDGMGRRGGLMTFAIQSLVRRHDGSLEAAGPDTPPAPGIDGKHLAFSRSLGAAARNKAQDPVASGQKTVPARCFSPRGLPSLPTIPAGQAVDPSGAAPQHSQRFPDLPGRRAYNASTSDLSEVASDAGLSAQPYSGHSSMKSIPSIGSSRPVQPGTRSSPLQGPKSSPLCKLDALTSARSSVPDHLPPSSPSAGMTAYLRGDSTASGAGHVRGLRGPLSSDATGSVDGKGAEEPPPPPRQNSRRSLSLPLPSLPSLPQPSRHIDMGDSWALQLASLLESVAPTLENSSGLYVATPIDYQDEAVRSSLSPTARHGRARVSEPMPRIFSSPRADDARAYPVPNCLFPAPPAVPNCLFPAPPAVPTCLFSTPPAVPSCLFSTPPPVPSCLFPSPPAAPKPGAGGSPGGRPVNMPSLCVAASTGGSLGIKPLGVIGSGSGSALQQQRSELESVIEVEMCSPPGGQRHGDKVRPMGCLNMFSERKAQALAQGKGRPSMDCKPGPRPSMDCKPLPRPSMDLKPVLRASMDCKPMAAPKPGPLEGKGISKPSLLDCKWMTRPSLDMIRGGPRPSMDAGSKGAPGRPSIGQAPAPSLDGWGDAEEERDRGSKQRTSSNFGSFFFGLGRKVSSVR